MEEKSTEIKSLERSRGKYRGCSVWWVILLSCFLFIILISAIFLLALVNKDDSSYWNKFIDFLPDAIGGCIGILVGFFLEATLFNLIKTRKQRKTLLKLLEEELRPIYNSLVLEQDIFANQILLKVIPIPITECTIKSVEDSALIDIKFNNGDVLLDLLYNIFSSYYYLYTARENSCLFGDIAKDEIEKRYVQFITELNKFLTSLAG